MFGDAQIITCPLCLEPGAAVLKLDKRGREFFRCRWCGSTAFVGTPVGLTSLLLLAPHASSILQGKGLTVRQAQAEALSQIDHQPAAAAGGAK
jgi:hypothetical protein